VGRVDDTALFVACFREASRSREDADQASYLLDYLEVFPRGAHNRAAAEAIERCLARMGESTMRDELTARLRALREPHMPPIEP
jgi:hypothetical protein